MPRNPSHDKALRPQNMTREERIQRVSKWADKPKVVEKGKKLFPEGDTTIIDSWAMVQNGMTMGTRLGRPLAFAEPEALTEEIGRFFAYCHEKKLAPTQVGLGLWLGINQDTLYAWKGDSTHPFSEILKSTIAFIQSFAEQKAMSGEMNPLIYFFQAKNYWGMQDKQEVNINASQGQVIDAGTQREIIEQLPESPKKLLK